MISRANWRNQIIMTEFFSVWPVDVMQYITTVVPQIDGFLYVWVAWHFVEYLLVYVLGRDLFEDALSI